MATLTLELPDDLADRLQTLVEVAGRSADAYVVASLVWYLGNIEKVHRETGDAIASPKPASWDSFFAAIQGVEVPADFLDDRERFPNGHACTRPPLYRQLEALPEWMTGEIIDGQVHTEPHPAAPVLFVGTALPAALHSIADTKNAWYVLWRPELHLVLDTEVLVPDLAAWRYERMRWDQEDQRFTVVPDWVCEVLSPVTRSKDREIKLPIYARFGVSFVWLIDPWARTLEAYALEAGAWRELGRFAGPDSVSVAPFEGLVIELADVWPPDAMPELGLDDRYRSTCEALEDVDAGRVIDHLAVENAVQALAGVAGGEAAPAKDRLSVKT